MRWGLVAGILLVSVVVAAGVGILNVDEYVPDEVTSFINDVITRFTSIGQGLDPGNNTGPGITNPPTTPGVDQGTSTLPVGTGEKNTRPWEQVTCIEPLLNPPGYSPMVPGWNAMDYPINDDYTSESYSLSHGAEGIFALGSRGSLLRLDDGIWNNLETNTTLGLTHMMHGTWPSYIVGGYGTVLSYSPVTGTIKKMETPWDDLDVYDRPSLYAAWGSNHEDFWVLGDGVMYNYAKLLPSHPNYNSSDPTPKWQWYDAPVSPWTLRGPYDSRISDVWVYDYDSVFALISNPGYGSYVTEWDGHEWGDAKEIPTTSLIRSIWGLGPDDIFAVGVAATVMHFDGAEWTEFNNIGLDQWNSYSSIWGTSHNNLFVVGDWAPYSSSLQRFDGEWWSGIEVPTIQGLGSVVGWSDALHSMYLTDYEGGIYGYYIVIAGADEDLDWMTYSGEYPSYISSSTSSDSTMYLSGSSGVNSQLFTYNYGGTLQTSDIDLGVSPQPGLSDIVEHEGILYGVGTTGTQIVVYMRNLESGEESNFFDSMENTTYLTSAIAVANDGSIYVGGQTMGDIGDQSWSGFVNGTDLSSYYYDPYCFDAFVMKFTPDGERLWVQVYGTPDSPLPFGNRVGERVDHIQIDKVGNVIIAGSSSKIEPFVIGDPDHGGMGVSLGNIADRGTLANGYMYIAALDESGSPQKVLGYGTGGYDIISSLEATSDGKYYLVGYSNYGAIIGGNMGTGTYDTLVMKLDSNLETIWTRYIGEPKNQIVNDAAVGLDDSLYLTGSTGGPIGGQNYAGNRDIYISHFSSEGLLLATRVLGGTQGDTGLLIEVDRSGSPVIWASVTSPLVFGYKSNSYGVMWRVGEMMVDNSAECRLR